MVCQAPMAGSDICRFLLWARWATLGAFYPFMRNVRPPTSTSWDGLSTSFVQHNADTSISQEFHIWLLVLSSLCHPTQLPLPHYIYTVFHHAHTDGGSPVPLPLWLKYHNAYGIDYQFGDSILVLPVTQDEATSTYFKISKGLRLCKDGEQSRIKATGKLHVDDGDSISPPSGKTEVWMPFGDSRGN
ncbi:glycoside hydrolase family 31 protein [Laccaria bicolor S238N-H82]|uniref:Glycoside hydrolase family 31 protein n=1 Tax=Laccaria bicolor (strain S238N-H82 / ATCC MYA-4686) TaxID=486041 RepID=B0D295_LACBS|nr:glycoside hydrolase family 31 protein [Laccaria bicolor S238N-H82]EDR10705.1 glycoside hydrolase family 31 protein [Laccaria bicolor S238N-H82]|eukprot:XP_001878006.1 glycoside hydrolase family 31 protein [Laccaria bicolor S238N-H82]